MSWGGAVASWGPYCATWGPSCATWGPSTFAVASDAEVRRHRVATAVRMALPAAWNVYASPPDVLLLPAVVVAPRSPYRELFTFTESSVHLAVQVIVSRSGGPAALDVIDAALDVILTALHDVENVTAVGDVAGVALAVHNGTDALVGSVDLTVS
jgi:hypothetical protein